MRISELQAVLDKAIADGYGECEVLLNVRDNAGNNFQTPEIFAHMMDEQVGDFTPENGCLIIANTEEF